jgi:hypothetical protein
MMASPDNLLARKGRTRGRNSAITMTSRRAISPSALEAAMAYFSDRFFSANKLIIAAAVVYAGAVTFAHAFEMPSAQCQADPVCFAAARDAFNNSAEGKMMNARHAAIEAQYGSHKTAVECVIETNRWIRAEIDAGFGEREIQDNYDMHLRDCVGH